MLTKFIYTSKIHSSRSINYSSTDKKNSDIYEKNTNTFIDYSQTINDVCENVVVHDPTKKKNVTRISSYDCRFGS